jgi:Raf kinase inhibitor-like YbhB/YbcL family protein
MGLNIKDLRIRSAAFEDGGRIPDRHTTNGENISPPLEWSGVPDGTRQLAVICHDPDAPLPDGFTHWLVYGVPPTETGFPEGGGKFTEGRNDFGDQGYGGCAPPPGHGTHRYYFWVYALDTEVTAGPGLTRAELLDQIRDHVVEQARTVGTYEQ